MIRKDRGVDAGADSRFTGWRFIESRIPVFDPFFTTKPPGEGTGLGLSTAARLAEELEGSLALAAPPAGFQTNFVLRLPVAARAEAAAAVRQWASEAAAAAPQALAQREADCGPAAAPAPRGAGRG